jgi:hypothetical protein
VCLNSASTVRNNLDEVMPRRAAHAIPVRCVGTENDGTASGTHGSKNNFAPPTMHKGKHALAGAVGWGIRVTSILRNMQDCQFADTEAGCLFQR